MAKSEDIVQAVQEFVTLYESAIVAAEVLKNLVPPGTNPERRGAQLGLCHLISQGDQGIQRLQEYFKADGNMHVFYGGDLVNYGKFLGLYPEAVQAAVSWATASPDHGLQEFFQACSVLITVGKHEVTVEELKAL